MKKLLKGTLCLALLCALCLASASAATAAPTPIQSGDYWYILRQDGSAEMTKYTGKEETLLIPSELDGHPVTGIGDYAFSDCSSLTSVTIPDSVTSMGSNPFISCGQLKTIQVSPDHPYLAVIGEALFSKPDKRLICYPAGSTATSYAIPQGIRQISDGAFYYCRSLTSVTIPNSVTSIGNYAFYYCSSLTSVTIPDSVTSIGEAAFNCCRSLTSVTIPDSVTSIDDYAFGDCRSLTSVTIPNSVTSIGKAAFYYCSSLASVTIPDSVTSIGDDAFSRCPDLTLTVPRGGYAAQYCKDNDLRYTYPDALDWLNN